MEKLNPSLIDCINLLVQAYNVRLKENITFEDDVRVVSIAAMRRSYNALLVIREIAKLDPYYIGDSILDLSRQIVEVYVTLQYIYLKDSKYRSQKFMNFRYIEEYNSVQFLKKFGVEAPGEKAADIEVQYKLHKDAYTYTDDKNRLKLSNNWAGNRTGIEEMLRQIDLAGKLVNPNLDLMAHMYNSGNTANHFSALSIMKYVYKSYETQNKGAVIMAMSITIVCALQLLVAYNEKYPPTEEDQQTLDHLIAQIAQKSETLRS